MAVTYEVSAEQGLVTVTANGTVTREDVDNLQSSILADDRICGAMSCLIDANDADPKLTFADLHDTAALLQQIFEKGIARLAIVARSTFVYSLAKTFGVFAASQPMRVRPFRDVSEAVAWLNSAA